jgi:hypothetical protein
LVSIQNLNVPNDKGVLSAVFVVLLLVDFVSFLTNLRRFDSEASGEHALGRLVPFQLLAVWSFYTLLGSHLTVQKTVGIAKITPLLTECLLAITGWLSVIYCAVGAVEFDRRVSNELADVFHNSLWSIALCGQLAVCISKCLGKVPATALCIPDSGDWLQAHSTGSIPGICELEPYANLTERVAPRCDGRSIRPLADYSVQTGSSSG